MIFTDLGFFAFFAVVFALYWGLGTDRWRKALLLVASYVFYGAWDWRFAFLLFATTAVDYAAGLAIAGARDGAWRRRFLVASLVSNLGVLGAFKYFGFFVDSAAQGLQALGLSVATPALSIVLPVGISFFTFQSMSYTIDVYRRHLPATRSLVDFALFVSFFPQLVAGPIVRATDFLPQLVAIRRFRNVHVQACLVLFWIGFVKKACIADQLAVPVNAVFADPAAYGALSKWIAVALYSGQIYCDFSGYTDMALGAAGLLGYRLTRNFDFPYFSTSIREFWRRWHISLSTWFRDYLYLPLGGNRGGEARTYRNLAIVFLLCGLWHGAAWTFVCWGGFHGLLLIAERGAFGRWLARLPALPRWIYAQIAVLIGWVFFRSADLGSALAYLADLAKPWELGASELPLAWLALLAGLIAVHWVSYRRLLAGRLEALPPWAFAAAYGVLAAVVMPWVRTGHVPFIYFQF